MDQEMMDALSLLFKQQEKKLEAVIDQRLHEQDKRLDEKFETHRKEMQVLIDTEITSKFNLLAEGQEEIFRRMPNPEDAEIVNGRLDVLEGVVKRLAREITILKKAN